MRSGAGLFPVLSWLLFAGACGAPKSTSADGAIVGQETGSPDLGPDVTGASDAGDGAGSGPFFCRGAQSLAGFIPTAGVPYVTLRDDTGQGCVFLMGDAQADPQTCGEARPTGYTEDCPFTAVDFDVWSDPLIATEFGVEGAYAWLDGAGRMGQSGRVLEMIVDSAAPVLTQGHFRVAFDPGYGFEGATAAGTFSLCTTPEVSVDPCRQPNPLPK